MAHEPDPLPILAELGVPAPGTVAPVSGGWDTSLWRVEAQGRRFALRVFRPEQEDVWRREAVALPALSDAGLPVPSVHAAGLAQGRPALLLSWCDGRTLLREVQARPWRMWLLGTAMGRMHARIHSVSVTDAAQTLPGPDTRKIIPYSAVIYDLAGQSWAYVNTEPRTYVRQPVTIDYSKGAMTVLKDGPAVGTPVVSVGAAELFGAETGVK